MKQGPRADLAERLAIAGSPVLTAAHVSEGKYLVRPHLVMIDRAVRRAIATGGRLIISMPPRHGKSELVSRYLPFWYLGAFPDRRVILASYEATFAATWGRKARELMMEHGGALWGLDIRMDSRSTSAWDIAGHDGGMVTAGVGGPLTGKGGHLIVVDDPVKNAKEAMSKVYREAAWDWYLSTLRTRLEPGGAMILMATRWHQDDLLGRVLRDSDEDWEVLSLPALAEGDDDPLGREPGEALWPERYSREVLESRRKESPFWFAAMYQGNPKPLEGGIFHAGHRRYWKPDDQKEYMLDDGQGILRRQLRIFATVDVAASERTSADYTVVTTWGWSTNHGHLLLLDRVRLQQATPKHRGLIREAYAKWGHAAIGIEATTYGLALLQELRTSGLPLVRLEADSDKVTRALPMAALYESGQVHHPQHAPWLTEWETELDDFPYGDHDDQVDTAGYAARMVAEWASVVAPSEDPPQDRRDDDGVNYDMEL